MPQITLPDGSKRDFDQAVTVLDVAKDIASSLAKATIAGVVNGTLVDASHLIEEDATLKIIRPQDEEGLEVIRHSTAHLLAQAVQSLYPDVQVTIGPVIEDGFYYDFAAEPFTPEDLVKIEAKMAELVKAKLPVERSTIDRDEAIAYFEGLGEKYKAEIIRDIPEGEVLSLYTQGDFRDLCRGPHVPNTSFLKVFKLTRFSGAYWRGDSNNEMLQRIYGTAWASKEDQDAYLKRMEEAAKRDHRLIGKQQQLFHMQEQAPGMVFWHDHGYFIWRTIENDIRERQRAANYQEIKTPQIADISLWEASGHAEKFGDDMFTTESENRLYALKPMNCPCHVQVYNQGLKSYRDLPFRLAEFGSCHRNEPSGALHGLMRVRGFVQDDGHIFCREDQIESEVADFMQLAFDLYSHYSFDDIEVKLATRPDERIGSDDVWDHAEENLANALKSFGVEFEYLPGEGAFYGPKVELHLKDSIGRKWQCGTIQLDFSMPKRLGAEYVDEHGERQTPYMLHRAAVGSLERFIGMYIEHCAGWFPVWISPIQAVVMGVTDKHREYCEQVESALKAKGLRAEADLRNEKIGFKIREHTLGRIPYQLVVGDKEIESNTVSVRTREGEDLGAMSVDQLADVIADKAARGGRID